MRNMYDILVRLRSLAACFRNGYCPGFGEWVTIHNRILADSSALAQKASRCAVSLSEQMFTVFGIAVAGFFSFPGFAVKPLICSHLFTS